MAKGHSIPDILDQYQTLQFPVFKCTFKCTAERKKVDEKGFVCFLLGLIFSLKHWPIKTSTAFMSEPTSGGNSNSSIAVASSEHSSQYIVAVSWFPLKFCSGKLSYQTFPIASFLHRGSWKTLMVMLPLL